MARDLDDARSIVAAAERTGVVCAIGYQWRAITWVPQMRELFAERALGLLAVRMFGSTAGRGWFTDQAAGGGQVLERASHGIDLVQAIAGPAVRVSATGVNVPLAGADRPPAARSTTCWRSRSSSSEARSRPSRSCGSATTSRAPTSST